MKKIVFCLLAAFSNCDYAIAQSFTIPKDTVNATVVGAATLHNDITNISADTIVVGWSVMSHDFPTDWGDSLGICDNALCYFNTNNSLLDGSLKTSDPIAPGHTANFYLLPNLIAASPGTHYVQIRLRDSTTMLFPVFIINKFPTGVVTATSSADIITVYPNPVSNILNLVVDLTKGKKTASIYNVSGTLMQRMNIETTKTELDISFLPGGIYTIRLTDEKGGTITTTTFSRI